MNYRQLGKTGLKVSALGFGCGAVGGLLVKGDRREMVRTIARAIELGVNYFDTAALYGDGQSETNLGAVLAELGLTVIVGTKVSLSAADTEDIDAAIIRSVETSLQRLRRETIDLIQLHNSLIAQPEPGRDWVSLATVEAAMRSFEKLAKQGKVRHWGITGLGETLVIQQALATGAQTVQCCFNLLNPSAGSVVSQDFPFQTYEQLIDKAAVKNMGVIAIRVLAAGALSGSGKRDSNAAQSVAPIASGVDLAADVASARRLQFLVDEGYVETLSEAAIRFAIGKTEVSTALVGISSLEQLEFAAKVANRGTLPAEALKRLQQLWNHTQ